MLIYSTPRASLLPDALKDVVCTTAFYDSPLSTVALSSNIVLDIAKCPHILIAGTTGSGKSVMLHNIICSLLLRNTTSTAEFLLIDPKMVELEYFYRDNPCLFCPVLTDPSEALRQIERAADVMMRRYDSIKTEGKRFWTGSKLYIVIDEIADLISAGGKRLEQAIEKIARLGRGAGVHLICATQYPNRTVISRQISTNMDTRICLRVNDIYASRLVIGSSGGEKLRGKGDALLRHNGDLIRFQGAYIDDSQLEAYAHSWSVHEAETYDPSRMYQPGTGTYLRA